MGDGGGGGGSNNVPPPNPLTTYQFQNQPGADTGAFSNTQRIDFNNIYSPVDAQGFRIQNSPLFVDPNVLDAQNRLGQRQLNQYLAAMQPGATANVNQQIQYGSKAPYQPYQPPAAPKNQPPPSPPPPPPQPQVQSAFTPAMAREILSQQPGTPNAGLDPMAILAIEEGTPAGQMPSIIGSVGSNWGPGGPTSDESLAMDVRSGNLTAEDIANLTAIQNQGSYGYQGGGTLSPDALGMGQAGPIGGPGNLSGTGAGGQMQVPGSAGATMPAPAGNMQDPSAAAFQAFAPSIAALGMGMGASGQALQGYMLQNSANLAPTGNQLMAEGATLSPIIQSLFGEGQNAIGAVPSWMQQGAAQQQEGLDWRNRGAAFTGQVPSWMQTGESLVGQGQSYAPDIQNILNTANDPQQALYERTRQQVQEQTRAGLEARGIDMMPLGAGLENDQIRNFNIDWKNAQLARQVQGAQGAASLGGLESGIIGAGNQTAATGLGLGQLGNQTAQTGVNIGQLGNQTAGTGINLGNLGVALTGAGQGVGQLQQGYAKTGAELVSASNAATQAAQQVGAAGLGEEISAMGALQSAAQAATQQRQQSIQDYLSYLSAATSQNSVNVNAYAAQANAANQAQANANQKGMGSAGMAGNALGSVASAAPFLKP
jgi:hypothetical protein